MTVREVILVLFLLFFIAMFLLNEYVFGKEKKRYTHQIRMHNGGLIFVQNSEMNIHEECYKDADFLKMQNFGKSPCTDRERHKFVNCIGKENYYEEEEDFLI